jgi:hypothetical protein
VSVITSISAVRDDRLFRFRRWRSSCDLDEEDDDDNTDEVELLFRFRLEGFSLISEDKSYVICATSSQKLPSSKVDVIGDGVECDDWLVLSLILLTCFSLLSSFWWTTGVAGNEGLFISSSSSSLSISSSSLSLPDERTIQSLSSDWQRDSKEKKNRNNNF